MKTSFVFFTLIFLAWSCKDSEKREILSVDTTSTTSISNPKYLDTKSKSDSSIQRMESIKFNTLPKSSASTLILVSSGQFSPCETVKIGVCDFELVLSENKIAYLSTNDKRFITPEGYKVGTTLSELPKELQYELTKESGWGYYYELTSGWSLGFCEGNSCTDNYPKPDSKVSWIFKRK